MHRNSRYHLYSVDYLQKNKLLL
uniref:Uncharacterized protein n=1 Tax=Anguilla anguilla TaxID=7936 RepID=A0A0E9XMF3_ANGAN